MAAHRGCTFGKLLRSLSEEDQCAVENAVARGAMWTSISRALRNNGHEVSDQSVMRHFKDRCMCKSIEVQMTYESLQSELDSL